MMTRKDYIEVASILKKYKAHLPHEKAAYMVMDFQHMMKQDNPRFDKVRFWNAVYKEDVDA